MGTSRTRKPSLQTYFHGETDPRTRDTFRQLEEYLGVGVVMQTEGGGNIPVRFNASSQQIEVHVGGSWRATSGSSAGAPPTIVQVSSGASGSSAADHRA